MGGKSRDAKSKGAAGKAQKAVSGLPMLGIGEDCKSRMKFFEAYSDSIDELTESKTKERDLKVSSGHDQQKIEDWGLDSVKAEILNFERLSSSVNDAANMDPHVLLKRFDSATAEAQEIANMKRSLQPTTEHDYNDWIRRKKLCEGYGGAKNLAKTRSDELKRLQALESIALKFDEFVKNMGSFVDKNKKKKKKNDQASNLMDAYALVYKARQSTEERVAATFADLHTDSGLNILDQFLSGKTFMYGDLISKDDVKVYAAVSGAPSADFYKNVSDWYNNVSSVLSSSFPGKAVGVRIGSVGEAPEKPPSTRNTYHATMPLIEVKNDTGLGLSYKKDENFGEWYSEVVVRGELIEHYDLSGCYILRPWTMSIWEIMQAFFDAEIKKMKIKNCSFPLFVSPVVLQKKKDHIEGFAPEVAWVTKSGQSDLEVPIAIRPTSETVMYPYYSKWIRGHRDLPLKLNQWCNVVRWEFSNPTPFIRSREFLWQEGHTAFATKEEADAEVLDILELYRCIYEEFLAIPVLKGKKSEHEKFAGGLYTTSVEAFIPHTGCGVQGATSHCLGQNFAKMFEINFENEKGGKDMVWQNFWAYSTRTIGVMVMVHGDDKGLVLPPKVAAIQVVVIPTPYKDGDTEAIYKACEEVVESLSESGIRAESDLRDNYFPGWKHSQWGMKGVPLRIEIGPNDFATKKGYSKGSSPKFTLIKVRCVRRDTGEKIVFLRDDMVNKVGEMLDRIQQGLFQAALKKRDACIEVVRTWDEFTKALINKKMILAPWCDEEEVEKVVKARTKGEIGVAKTLCSPFEQPELIEGTLCFASGKPAKKWTYWGRSY